MTTQLITPNPNITCIPGECLVYVRETFGIGPKYPSATAGWNASPYQHADQNFPDGIWVPVWFAMQDEPDGHVALRQPDGSIWSSSSPTETTPVHHPSLADLERYYGGRLTYRGWTDDIEGVKVVDEAASIEAATGGRYAHHSPNAQTLQPLINNSWEMRIKNMQRPDTSAYAGHAPGHPAIEHMRIGLEIDKRIAEEKARKHKAK